MRANINSYTATTFLSLDSTNAALHSLSERTSAGSSSVLCTLLEETTEHGQGIQTTFKEAPTEAAAHHVD
jgi:hypothetical protein